MHFLREIKDFQVVVGNQTLRSYCMDLTILLEDGKNDDFNPTELLDELRIVCRILKILNGQKTPTECLSI